MQQLVVSDDENEDAPDDLLTTGEQKVLQKISTVFNAKTPQSVRHEIKQEDFTPTVDDNISLEEYIDKAYDKHVSSRRKNPIPGSANWYPPPPPAN